MQVINICSIENAKKKFFDNYSIENASYRQMFSRKYNTKKLSMTIL